MKIQNLAIIFIVIILPLLMILGYYLNLQEETLEMQSDYNSKLATATKEGIRAYEINTVNWREVQGETRRNVTASVNTFLTSLANNLGIAGTAKEYMVNYVPAVVMTMYDGYYIYAPSYVPKTIENSKGIQLYYNGSEVTTEVMNAGVLNDVIYEPSSSASNKKTAFYIYENEQGTTVKEQVTFTTDSTQAAKTYKHSLSNEIAYSGTYTTATGMDVTINYTLDNRIYVYGKKGTEAINEQGCLVDFDSAAGNSLPKIKVKPNAKDESDITVINKVNGATYYGSNINSEILTEQILYKDGSQMRLGTFKYIYDVTGTKYYYDENVEQFFTLNANREKILLADDGIRAGDAGCKYKSVSVLIDNGTATPTEYKKLYQALNGRDKGKWYISLKEDPNRVSKVGPGVEVIDTELKATRPEFEFTAIYRDYSAVSYYVEAYAFTNWMRENLGGKIEHTKVVFDEASQKYVTQKETINGLFNITADNDIEKELSMISEHKRQIMIDSINSNLNLSISNYSRNSPNEYRLPVLTEADWDQVFTNISMIAFFQGAPIGLKTYNNYSIATSTQNRDYVDPDEIFFSSKSESYHRPYCTHMNLNDIQDEYMGYRSVEYTLRTYEKDDINMYYYQHTRQQPQVTNADLACYYCIINKASYENITEKDKATLNANEKSMWDIQVKAYKEALARERYYQYEQLAAELGIIIRYHQNLEVGGTITGISGIPDDQEAQPNIRTQISSQIPQATTNDSWLVYRCVGWSLNPNSTTMDYVPGESYVFSESVDLYAIWTVSLAKLNWKTDWKWTWTKGDANKDYGYFIPGGRNVAYVNDGSISHGIFSDDSGGSIIEMEGNGTNLGKGACWTEFTSDFLEISEFAFDFNVVKGDSFNAAGFMFNVKENTDSLEGYLFSINFSGQFNSKAGGKSGAIYKFKYMKNANTSYFEELQLVQGFDIRTSGGGRNSGFNGSVKIKVTDTGYIFTSDFSEDVPINVGERTASFGFFSEHYSHGCDDIGYFKLYNIKVSVTQK